jgi:hypothetical protein
MYSAGSGFPTPIPSSLVERVCGGYRWAVDRQVGLPNHLLPVARMDRDPENAHAFHLRLLDLAASDSGWPL